MHRWIQALMLVGIGGVILCHPLPARADLMVCNKTAQSVSIAYATVTDSVAITRGWDSITPGACRHWAQFDGAKAARDHTSYYYYARNSSGGWPGDKPFCVDIAKDFSFTHPLNRPPQDCEGILRWFRAIDLKTRDGILNLDVAH